MFHDKIRRKKYSLICCFSILWMLLCPENFIGEEFSCLVRADGEQLTKEDAVKIWHSLLVEDTKCQEISVTYKSLLLDWLEKEYHID